MGAIHEGTDEFSEISHLYPNLLEENVAGTSTHDHDCFWVKPGL